MPLVTSSTPESTSSGHRHSSVPEATITLDVPCVSDQYIGHHEHYYHHRPALGRSKSTSYHARTEGITSAPGTAIGMAMVRSARKVHPESILISPLDPEREGQEVAMSTGRNASTASTGSINQSTGAAALCALEHLTVASHLNAGEDGGVAESIVSSYDPSSGAMTTGDTCRLNRKSSVTFRSGGRVYHHKRSNSTNSQRSLRPSLLTANVDDSTIRRSLTITTHHSHPKHSTSAHSSSTLQLHSCLRKSASSTSQLANPVHQGGGGGGGSGRSRPASKQASDSSIRFNCEVNQLAPGNLSRRPSDNYDHNVHGQRQQRSSFATAADEDFDDDCYINDVDIEDETLATLADGGTDGDDEDNQQEVSTSNRDHKRRRHNRRHHRAQQRQPQVNVLHNSRRGLISNKIEPLDRPQFGSNHKLSAPMQRSASYRSTSNGHYLTTSCPGTNGEIKDVLTYTKCFMIAAYIVFICGSGITVNELIDFLTESSSSDSSKYISGLILLAIGAVSLFGLYGTLREDSCILMIYGALILLLFIGHVILLFTLKNICLSMPKKCYNNMATPPGIAPIIVAISELAIALSAIFMSLVIESSRRRVHAAGRSGLYSTSSSSISRRNTVTEKEGSNYNYSIVSQDDDAGGCGTGGEEGGGGGGTETGVSGVINYASRRKQLTSTSSSSSQGQGLSHGCNKQQ